MRFYFMVGVPYALMNGWIVWWVWRALEGAGAVRPAVCLLLAGLALLFPLTYKDPQESALHVALLRAGALWAGVFIYVFLAVLCAEAAGLVARVAGSGFGFSTRLGLFAAVMGLPCLIGAAGVLNALHPVVLEYDITVPSSAAAGERRITIGAVSDIHLGRLVSAKRLDSALALLAPHKPDALLFLGDILDDQVRLDMQQTGEALKRLDPPLGVFGITGNHEYISGPVANSLRLLEKAGIRMLRDEWIVLDDALLVTGRDDYSRPRFIGSERKTLDAILASVPEDKAKLPLLVLDHQPHHLEEAEAAGAVLQLSGHTHYGQFVPFNLLMKRLYENPRGHSRRGGTHYIVSAGAGTWGPPLRNTSRPDVLLVRLHIVPE